MEGQHNEGGHEPYDVKNVGQITPERLRNLAAILNEDYKTAISSNNVEYVACLLDNMNALLIFANWMERAKQIRERLVKNRGYGYEKAVCAVDFVTTEPKREKKDGTE